MFNKIHFVGICGISMSALAIYCKTRGQEVSGSDGNPNHLAKKLQDFGIKVFSHDKNNIDKTIDLCVKSAAVSEQNEEIVACRKLGIKVVDRAELLSNLLDEFKYSIAVSGSHGKTTTTAMIFAILKEANKFPTMFLGGEYGESGNLHIGQKDFCVVEACEYAKSFLQLKPFMSVVLNADYEHPDCYADLNDVYDAFKRFVSQTNLNGVTVVNFDLQNYIADSVKNVVTFGENPQADFCAKNIKTDKGKCNFDIASNKVVLGNICINLQGKHNVSNALAAYAVAKQFDIPHTTIAKALKDFCGVKRRFERFESDFTNVIADYAHHPTEISSLMAAVKQMNYQKIYVIFQPHTFSRTKKLINQFAKCFDGATKVLVLPVYAAREKYDKEGDSYTLSKKINENIPSIAIESFAKVALWAKTNVGKNDLLLIVGAGDIIEMCVPKYLNKFNK